MKYSEITCKPVIFMSQIMATVFLGAFILIAVQNSALAGNCENPRYASKNPDECGGEPPPPPPGQERTLEVTVRFGDENDDLTQSCADNSCIETTFAAVGNVICSSQMCDFVGTVSESDSAFFNIPPSLLNLLAMTSIRGTQILPERCFTTIDSGFPFTDAGHTKDLIYEFVLRSPVVAKPDARWWAKVRAVSDDMAFADQNYGFHFGGLCDRTGSKCPPLSDLVDSGEYENGWTSAVFGSNTNKRGEPQTCRCTVSSKPSCPDHVDMGPDPRPAAHIFIDDL